MKNKKNHNTLKFKERYMYVPMKVCDYTTIDCKDKDCEECGKSYIYIEKVPYEPWMQDEIGKNIFISRQQAENRGIK